MRDHFWAALTSRQVLQRAAHLVGADSRHDFQESLLDRQIFSHYRDQIITEIIHSLNSGRYLPAPATPVSIPKSDLSRRPGFQLPYRDRVVLQAIAMILAPLADAHLSDSVWSWRVKAELRGKPPSQVSKRGLFRETDISDFPFLKRKTIRKYIEEFEPWYALWPEFDERTKIALADEEYKYMLFSDISGYFENINLQMLRDLLMRLVPNANNTINLLMSHLYAWCPTTYDGAATQRGIPQGNAVSSFLGNVFLKPIDDYFESFVDNKELKYFRYMDDIRIVSKTREGARQAALALEDQIRRCQLNLQSSKTKLLPANEALRTITDGRLEKLDILLPSYQSKTISRERLLSELRDVARDKGDSIDARSISSGRALDGLNLRVLRRWAATHYEAKSDVPVRRLMVEALNNPNYKVTRELLRIGRTFPHRRQIAASVSKFICERRPQFEYHEAELLRALRHFHELPDEIYAHAERNATGNEYEPYVRVQSAMLLMRRPGELASASRIVQACMASPELQVILVGVLCSSLDRPRAVAGHLRGFATHASHDVARQYIRALRHEEEPRQGLLSFVFGVRETLPERVYNYAAFLRFISTGDVDASRALIELCDEQLVGRYLNRELRRFLSFLRARSHANIAFLARRGQLDLE